MCQTIGCGPIGTIGFGRSSVTSLMRVPIPPQRIIAGGISADLPSSFLRMEAPKVLKVSVSKAYES